MSWKMYRWVWRVVSPLHIGLQPAGALNRTRLYIPARTLWGALTAELARRQSNAFPDYQKTGECLCREVRFGYLFPAERVNGKWQAWLPDYEQGEGLVWQREDGQKREVNRLFRRLLLVTRPGTAIDPASDSAGEGTLREYEILGQWWRSQEGDTEAKPVAMTGYLFSKDDTLSEQLKDIQELFVGGDTRYGLGCIKRIEEAKQEDAFFGCRVYLNGDSPIVHTSRVLAHTIMQDSSVVLGNQECIRGWNNASETTKPLSLVLAPGSHVEKEHDFVIQEEGLWKMRSNE